MTELVFVDTNVLVYSRDASEPAKQPRAWAWREALWRQRLGRLSSQVLHEYYVVVTRKLSPGLTREQARAEVEDLSRWEPVALGGDVLRAAWEAEDEHQLSFWDALILAAAHASGCRYLLSEDFGAGRDYGGVMAINPFATSPSELA